MGDTKKNYRKMSVIALLVVVFITFLVKVEFREKGIMEDLNTSGGNAETDNYQEDTNSELIGTWAEINPESGEQYIKFLTENTLELGDRNSSTKVDYEVVRAETNQLYVYLKIDGARRRVPFGIFKIEGSILLWRDSTEVEGSQNLQLPTDFSADTIRFEKLGKNQ